MRYLLGRVLHSILVVVGVSFLVFGLVHLGGDPAAVLMPLEATTEQVEAFRRQEGLDQPILVQYARFVRRAAVGDFGTSMRHREPALGLVLNAFPATAKLAGIALAGAVLVAVPLGIISAVKRDTWVDTLTKAIALLGQAVPTFWLGLVLILLMGVRWRLVPISGAGTWKHLVMPGITLALYTSALIMRLLRSSMLEVLTKDFMRTARAKGLPERVVIFKHALRNAAIPVITIVALRMGPLLGGAVITEEVFAYPGMGRLALNAIANRDLPVVQAFVFAIATVIVISNLVADMAYVALDPRIRYA